MNAMKKTIIYGVIIIAGLAVLFFMYNPAHQTETPTVVQISETPIKIPPPLKGVKIVEPHAPQKLPSENIIIQTKTGKTINLNVEIAKRPHELRKGMMFRTEIPPMTGMLFLFSDDRVRSFWMKNTLVPLDMLFIRNDGTIDHIHINAEPESLEPIKSKRTVTAVLELAGGESERLSIHEGDRILHTFFNIEE